MCDRSPLTLLDTAIYASCSSNAVLARNYDEVFFSDEPEGFEREKNLQN
jgi:hypothetical protein